MKTLRILCTSAATCLAMMLTAQNKIAVQSGNNVTFFDQGSLQAALDAAQNGDVVYLPGSTFTGSFTLNRSIQLIGAGYFPDSSAATTPTAITGNFLLTTNASNSYISGISFATYVECPYPSVPVINNIVFHRCYLQGGYGTSGSGYWMSSNSSGVFFTECILGAVYLNNAKNCIFRNCIFTSGVQNGANASIQSSIFLMASGIVINGCANCIIQGNIFYGGSITIQGASTSYASAYANCFVATAPTLQYTAGTQNVLGANAGQMFVAYTPPYDYTDNLHLGPSSAAIGAGPGGIECGIYGGPSSWKPGGVPYNPHIQQQFIGTATDPQGGLPVQIKVAAQGQ